MNRFLVSLSAAAAMLTVSAATIAQSYPDVPTGHWAYDAVEQLTRDGVLKGYPDGKFRGKQTLTRYEFAIALRDAIEGLQDKIASIKPGGTTVTPPAAAPQLSDAQVAKVNNLPDNTVAELKKLQDDAATIQKLAREFQDELAALGVDVEAVKKDQAALAARVKAIEEEMARFKVNGTIDFGIVTSHTDGSKTAADLNGNPTKGSLFTEGSMLHEVGFDITAKLSDTTNAEATVILGNYLGYLGDSASQFYTPVVNPNADAAIWKAQFNAPVSVLGQEVALSLGRVQTRVNPWLYWRANNDAYFGPARYKDGYYSIDGGKLATSFGPVNVMLFGGKNSSVTSINSVGEFMEVASVSPFTASLPTPTWTGGLNVGMSFMENKVKLDASYIGLRMPRTWISATNYFNAMAVYGASLEANLVEKLTLGVDFGQSDLNKKMTGVVTKNNWNLAAKAGYSLDAGSMPLALSVGYRETQPFYAAPGYWGRMGNWYNPTGIRGFDGSISTQMNALGLSVKGGYYEGISTKPVAGKLPASYFGPKDKITHIDAALTYALSEKATVGVEYETVQWTLKSSEAMSTFGLLGKATPQQNFITLSTAYNLNDNTALKLMYQMIDSNDKGVALPGQSGVLGKQKGGMLAGQASIKF